MRQGNGTDLLGLDDPRGASIGIIDVSPTDERKSVLAALITQDELGRKQVAVVLPQQNKAFQHPVDFDDLKGLRRQLQTQIVFIAPNGPGPAEFARQRRFLVYSSLENFAQSLREEEPVNEEKKFLGIFGGKKQKSTDSDNVYVSEAASPTSDEPIVTKPVPDPLIIGAAIVGAGAINQPLPQNNANATNYSPVGTDVARPSGEIVGVGAESPRRDRFIASAAPNVPVTLANSAPEPKPIDLTLRTGRKTAKLPAPALAPLSVASNANAQKPGDTPGNAIVAAPVAASNVSPKGGATPMQGNTGSGGAGGAGGVGRNGSRRGGGNNGKSKPHRARTLVIALLLLLLTLLVICAALTYVQPGLAKTLGISKVLSNVHVPLPTSNVTVTVLPASQTISNSYIISGVTGTANATQEQVSVRQLSYTTPAATVNVTGSGVHNIPATTANGTLTFYNAALSPQQVSAGTVFVTSGGVKIVNETAAPIPAATLSGNGTIFGSVSVPAQAVNVGASGNIGALAISGPCCTTDNSILVKNLSAFSGGQDAKHYTFIQQGDVNSAIAQLQPGLVTKAQAGLKAQVQSGEQLVNTAQCSPTSNVNQPIGDHGSNVPSATVSVTVTCTAETYKQSDLTTLVQTLLMQKAQTQAGAGYTLVGEVVTATTVQDVKQGAVSLLVNAKGVYAYQFSTLQKQQLANLIKGLSASQAVTKLESQTGVASASVPNGVTTLPSNASQIMITVQLPTGFTSGGTAPGGVTPTVTGPGAGTGTPTPIPGNGEIPSLF